MKMRVAVLILAATIKLSVRALDVSEADSLDWVLFDSFMTNHSRTYTDDTELGYRFQVFQQSLERQRQLNAYESKHGGTAVYGINKFSDLTPQEFKNLYLSGLVPSKGVDSGESKDVSESRSVRDLPLEFDWSTKNVIGPILDQQRCGSCWAFAVVETIASAYAIENGHLYQLSPQQLISCDYHPNISLDGCRGGSLKEAFQTSNGTVIVQESVYPFASKNGETFPCKQSLPQQGLQLFSYNYSTNMNEEDMRAMLESTSPLTTSVNAITWQDYIGGIIQHHCSGPYYDHAIQIIGYDLTGDVPYWRIRNTWGTDWGEDGFVRVLYGNKMCGLNIEVTSVLKVNSVNLQNDYT